MHFTDLLFALTLMSTVFVSSISCFWQCNLKDQEIRKKQLRLEQSRFISKSFVKTCDGEGFASLNQWEYTCNALCNLCSIQWEKTISSKNCQGEDFDIFYGKWAFEDEQGEIYSKVNKNARD